MDAVGADQHVAAVALARLAGDAVGEMRGDPRLVLHETGHPAPGADRVGAQPLDHRVVQHLLQPPAMDRELRHLVTRMHATQLGPDLLSLLGEVTQLARPHAHGVQCRQQPQVRQFPDGMGQHVDADTDLAHLARRFVKLHRHAAGVQHQRRGQPADARPCDQDAHVTPPLRGAGNPPRAWRRSRPHPPGSPLARGCAAPRKDRRAAASAPPRKGI